MISGPLVAQSANSKSNMAGAWAGVWSKITASVPQLPILLTIIALALVAFAAVKYLMQRRQGGGGNNTVLIWTLAAAAAFAAPGMLFPLVLKLADGFINFLGSVGNTTK